MKRMIPLALLALPAVAAAKPARQVKHIAETGRRPNIVVILADDQGYGGVNCYPHKKRVVTPNIDALAQSGVKCMQGYVTGYVSSPTRAGLLTGKYQQSFGFYGLDAPGAGGVPADTRMVSQYLQEAGYATACIGKWHVGDYIRNHPNNRGFGTFYGFINGLHDYFDPLVGGSWDGVHTGLAFMLDNMDPVAKMDYATYEFTARAVRFIEQNAAQPFFLYLPYNAIHSPVQAPEELVGELADDPRKVVTEDKVRAMTFALDQGVGKVMATLDRLGIRDNTIIVYLSDNGGVDYSDNWILRGRKGSCYEGGIRVPFIVSYPGVIPAGTEYANPVISIDIAPTALALAGIRQNDMQGVDLLPYLRGENKGLPHEVLYWSSRKSRGKGPEKDDFAIRQGKWKLVSDPSLVKDCNLYDLEADPGEKNGLKEKYPEKYDELYAAYLKWIDAQPENLFTAGGNARLSGMDLMRKYQQALRKDGKKVPYLRFGPAERRGGEEASED